MDKNKMLIDATHPEETRVVVLRNGRVEEFDYESASRKLLRGNIYLAKVTRVEPSLQAAFVEYGGNRHGFLAFSEIHPDYYQIPIADRELLKQEEAEAEAAAEAEVDERARQRDRRRRRGGEGRNGGDRDPRSGGSLEAGPEPSFDDGVRQDDSYSHDNDHSDDKDRSHGRSGEPQRASALEHDHDHTVGRVDEHGQRQSEPAHGPEGHSSHDPAGYEQVGHEHGGHEHRDDDAGDRTSQSATQYSERDDQGSGDHGNVEDIDGSDRHSGPDNGSGEADQVEQVAAGEDALEELPERPRRRARQYKIQEVIKRRQIILIQVVKEERGNKGAALTTYISLAGRYTVLMPNTGRGGGISRKITQPQDRKRLKAIAEDLEVGEGMGLIIRTAGAAQSLQEIKRDYEYLLRLWESVRDLTLTSTAPCLVYEEGNLIKRSIRDLYSKDIDDIQVAGGAAYTEASDFMAMLMPGHQDSVINYTAPEPLFARFGIERQLNAMFNPVVTLRSGGYIVINQTEALVAIDVNSGKSTREFSIEETALNTNLEASEEIARQLKLRDLAGLIVVDFIDMEEKRNNRTVERRMKDALRHDRARIQVGRISHFGLLEMSRQRLRTGVVEGSTSQCPHCVGTGIIRSTESIALAVLRGIEDNLMKQPASLAVTTNAGVALYILNNKRPYITEIERRFGIAITVEASDRMHGANFAIERTSAAAEYVKPAARTAVSMDWGFDATGPEAAEETEAGRVVLHEHRPSRDRDREAGDRSAHDRGRRDHQEPRESRDDQQGRDDQHGRDEVRAEGEEGGRSRRRRRRRGRRDHEGDADRSPVQRDEAHTATNHAENDRAGPGYGQESLVHDDHANDRPARDTGELDAGHAESRGATHLHGGSEMARDHVAGAEPGQAGGDVTADRDEDGQHGASGRDAADGDENRPKRGRRRGRRGGRSRGRDDAGYRHDSPRVAGEAGQPDNADWGLLEVAKPGAEQPVGLAGAPPVDAARDYGRGIVTTTDAPMEHASRFEAPAPRTSIVETAPAFMAEPARAADPVRIVETVNEPAQREYSEPARSPAAESVPVSAAVQAEEANRPARKGWWQRRFGNEKG